MQWQKYKLNLKSSILHDYSILRSFSPDKEEKLNFCIDDESGLIFIKYGSWKSYLLIVQLLDLKLKSIDQNNFQEPAAGDTTMKTANHECCIISNEAVLDVDWKDCRLLGMVYHSDNENKQKRQKKQKQGKTYQFLLALNGNFKSWTDNLFIIDVTIDINSKYDYIIKMCKNEKLTKILSTSAKQVLDYGEDGVYIDDGLYFDFSNYSYSIYKKHYMIFVGGIWSDRSGWSCML